MAWPSREYISKCLLHVKYQVYFKGIFGDLYNLLKFFLLFSILKDWTACCLYEINIQYSSWFSTVCTQKEEEKIVTQTGFFL